MKTHKRADPHISTINTHKRAHTLTHTHSDLVDIYGAEMRPLVQKPWMEQLLAKGRRSKEKMTKTMAQWATEKIRKL